LYVAHGRFLLPYAPPVKRPSQKKVVMTVCYMIVSGAKFQTTLWKKHKSTTYIDAIVYQMCLSGDLLLTNASILARNKLALVIPLITKGLSWICSWIGALMLLACHLRQEGCTLKVEKKLAVYQNSERNDLVYVTCGEPWSDPKLSYSEQQRRAVLANLAADISHIRQYCTLRDPSGIFRTAPS
ncbi:hypothetical protein OS493_028550, partial [Desmophyllum pertusum]